MSGAEKNQDQNEPAAGGGGFMEEIGGFFSRNAAPIIASVVGLIGMSMGGFMGIILAVLSFAAAGIFAFMPGVVEQAKGYLPERVRSFFGEKKHQPQSQLPVEIIQSLDESNVSIIKIDGREYEVTVTPKEGKTGGKLIAEKVTYKEVGSDGSGTELDFGDKGIVIGGVAPSKIVNDAMFLNMSEKIAHKIRTDKYVFIDKNKVRDIEKLDENSFTLKATKSNVEYLYQVELGEIDQTRKRSVTLKDAEGNILQNNNQEISTTIDAKALNIEGIRAREFAALVDKANGTELKVEAVQLNSISNVITVGKNPTYNVQRTDVNQPGITTGTFTINGNEAEYEIHTVVKGEAEVAQKVTISQNGRKYEYKPESGNGDIGSWQMVDGKSRFVENQDGLKALLKEASDSEDNLVKNSEKNLRKIEGGYFLEDAKGSFLIKVTGNKDSDRSYSITNLATPETSEPISAKGSEAEAVREAIKDLLFKEQIDQKSSPTKGDEEHARPQIVPHRAAASHSK